jgi:hypothetical protein
MLYQSLMLFSWAIYTEWFPRSLYHFKDHFFSYYYFFGTGLLYSILIWGLFKTQIRNNRHKALATLIAILLIVSLFLGKGSQAPFGELFMYLYNNFPLFRVFRSADVRFGFTSVLFIALLLQFSANYIRNRNFIILIFVVIMLQSFYLINGEAITGEEIPGKYFDRIVHIGEDQREVIEFFNSRDNQQTYILISPSVNYGNFLIEEGERFVSQDILNKFVNIPFVYSTAHTSGLKLDVGDSIEHSIKSGNYEKLKTFPFQYILLRRDVTCSDCPTFNESELMNISQNVFENDLYTVFEIDKPSIIISGSTKEFKIHSPTRIDVSLKETTGRHSVNLLLSNDDHWQIYNKRRLPLLYLFENPIGTRLTSDGAEYANSWTIENEELINNTVTLFYRPQAQLYATYVISITSVITLVGIIIVNEKRNA